MRVAGPRQTPWEEGTEIKNLSLSGLAFTAPVELCPIVGEFIKIQFHIPGRNEMACYGLVTRLEVLPSSEMLVGVQFYKLEMPHRIVLLQGLAQRLKEQQKKNAAVAPPASFNEFITKILLHKKAAALMLLFLSVWIFLSL